MTSARVLDATLLFAVLVLWLAARAAGDGTALALANKTALRAGALHLCGARR